MFFSFSIAFSDIVCCIDSGKRKTGVMTRRYEQNTHGNALDEMDLKGIRRRTYSRR